MSAVNENHCQCGVNDRTENVHTLHRPNTSYIDKKIKLYSTLEYMLHYIRSV